MPSLGDKGHGQFDRPWRSLSSSPPRALFLVVEEVRRQSLSLAAYGMRAVGAGRRGVDGSGWLRIAL